MIKTENDMYLQKEAFMEESRQRAANIPKKIRIGTRGSKLAQRQTDIWIEEIKKVYPHIVCEKVVIKTEGDKILDRPLIEFGGKGVFVTELERLIKAGEIDYAVHSAKDMPMELAEGLDIVCVPERADARDVLITRKDHPVRREDRAVIGTGSLRRQIQLKQFYPQAEFCSLRGNVDTRLEKLKNGAYDGIVLAAAGLQRVKLDREAGLIYNYFELEDVIPAGGQAVIAVEGRTGSEQDYLDCISDKKTVQELAIERYVMQKLGTGCHEAVGVHAQIVFPQQVPDMQTPSCLMTRNVAWPEKRVRLSVLREKEGRAWKKNGENVLRNWKSLADDLIDSNNS